MGRYAEAVDDLLTVMKDDKFFGAHRAFAFGLLGNLHVLMSTEDPFSAYKQVTDIQRDWETPITRIPSSWWQAIPTAIDDVTAFLERVDNPTPQHAYAYSWRALLYVMAHVPSTYPYMWGSVLKLRFVARVEAVMLAAHDMDSAVTLNGSVRSFQTQQRVFRERIERERTRLSSRMRPAYRPLMHDQRQYGMITFSTGTQQLREVLVFDLSGQETLTSAFSSPEAAEEALIAQGWTRTATDDDQVQVTWYYQRQKP
jgi:hypothetical protein